MFVGVEKYSSYDVLNAFFDEGSFNETDAYLKGESGEKHLRAFDLLPAFHPEAGHEGRRRDEQGAVQKDHRAL